MTSTELTAIGQARFGAGWQSALARAIGVDPRTIRRFVAGAPISDGIAHDIRVVLGYSNIEQMSWPRDEWLLGDGGAPQHREYIAHLRPPRFVARVVEGDAGAEADLLTGITYSAADGTTLCEIVWIDPPPPDAELRKLLRAAAAHIEAES